LNDQELIAHKIPKNINSFFGNLELLNLKNTSIDQLFQDDISQFKKLKVLIMWINLIKALDGKVFAQNSALIYIDFEDNMLTNTGTKLLKPLTELNYAYFSNNICTDSSLNNTTDLELFKVQLSSNCPPTFDMLVGEILEDSIFLDKINTIISEKINDQQPGSD